jgi:hypothetical protein
LFNLTLLPNIRPRSQPLIDLASSDLLPQIPPRLQPIAIPEIVLPRIPQPGVAGRRDRRHRPDQDEGHRRAEEIPLRPIGEGAARTN